MCDCEQFHLAFEWSEVMMEEQEPQCTGTNELMTITTLTAASELPERDITMPELLNTTLFLRSAKCIRGSPASP